MIQISTFLIRGKNVVKPKTHAWKGNVVGGDRPNLAFVLYSWQENRQ